VNAPSFRVPIAIAALVALVVAPLAPRRAEGANCRGVERDGVWTIAAAPDFPAGEQAISDHVVVGTTMVVTNGSVVMASRDSGCEWAESFALPQSSSAEFSYTDSSADITSLEVIDHSLSAPVVAAIVREDAGGASRPHVAIGNFASPDGEWSSGDAGLPPAGEPEFIADAPSDGATAYLGIDVGGGAIDLLYASTDGGTSWSLRSDIATLRPQAGISILEVDPVNAEDMWAGGSGGLFHSADGGRSFQAIPQFTGEQIGIIDVSHSQGPAARVIVYSAAQQNLRLTYDVGASWHTLPSPPQDPTSIAHGENDNEVAVTTSGNVWLLHATTQSWFPLDPPLSNITDLLASPGAQVTYHGRTTAAIASYRGSTSGIDIDIDGDTVTNDVDLIHDPDDLKAAASLRQRNPRVVVPLNGEKTVPYDLAVPKKRVPVDLVFLLDTSSSMTRFTAGLADAYADIANGLVAAGLDVQFGVAEHRAYPDFFPPRSDEPNFVYRKLVDIGPDGGAVSGALESLETEGGGIYDAQLGALHALATGDYQDVFPPGPSDHDVQPGHEMEFRSDAPLRIVVLGTDEPFGGAGEDRDPGNDISPNPPPDVPTFDEVSAALNAERVKLIGLAIGPESQRASDDLSIVANATDARAPIGGVDCDGDGTADLPAGQALVCRLGVNDVDDARHLAPAIVNLVEAVRIHTDIGLSAGGQSTVVERISPDHYRGIAVQKQQDLRFDVTFKCNLTQAGKTYSVDLEATEKNRVLDSLTTTVVCSERPDFILPAFLTPLVAVAAPPPPAPPPGIPEIASQVNSQAQFHGAAAAAHQEEQQPQLALVNSFDAEQQQLAEEYEMSSYRRSREPEYPTLPLGAAALLMGLGYGVAVQRRDRVQLAKARARY
jgi:photosystem II stability/assembly factor-like uncharacterized protein